MLYNNLLISCKPKFFESLHNRQNAKLKSKAKKIIQESIEILAVISDESDSFKHDVDRSLKDLKRNLSDLNLGISNDTLDELISKIKETKIDTRSVRLKSS